MRSKRPGIFLLLMRYTSFLSRSSVIFPATPLDTSSLPSKEIVPSISRRIVHPRMLSSCVNWKVAIITLPALPQEKNHNDSYDDEGVSRKLECGYALSETKKGVAVYDDKTHGNHYWISD